MTCSPETDGQTDRRTDRQTDEVITEDTLSGFQDFPSTFHQGAVQYKNPVMTLTIKDCDK